MHCNFNPSTQDAVIHSYIIRHLSQKLCKTMKQSLKKQHAYHGENNQRVVTPKMQVHFIPYPQEIPRNPTTKILYARKEPFEDPKDEDE